MTSTTGVHPKFIISLAICNPKRIIRGTKERERRHTLALPPILTSHEHRTVRVSYAVALVLLIGSWTAVFTNRSLEGTILSILAILFMIPGVVHIWQEVNKAKKKLYAAQMRVLIHTELMKFLDEERYDKMLKENPRIKAALRDIGVDV